MYGNHRNRTSCLGKRCRYRDSLIARLPLPHCCSPASHPRRAIEVRSGRCPRTPAPSRGVLHKRRRRPPTHRWACISNCSRNSCSRPAQADAPPSRPPPSSYSPTARIRHFPPADGVYVIQLCAHPCSVTNTCWLQCVSSLGSNLHLLILTQVGSDEPMEQDLFSPA